jgi:signal transduction histidine kinase
MKLADEKISEFLDLRFSHFSEYAKFILSNRLNEFVDHSLDASFEVNVPILKHLKSFSRNELFQMGINSNREMLSAIANNSVDQYISNSRNNWLSNSLSFINRDQVIAEDITLISYVRRKTFRSFLAGYTNDPLEYIRIMDEVDKFTLVADSVFLNTLIKIQQEQIAASNDELEKRERLMDISEKYTIIKRLEESEAQNKQAEALTHIGNWSWIPHTNEIRWSDELFRIYGLEPQSEQITVQTFTDFLHEEDREYFASEWNNSLKSMKVLEQNFKIFRRDGSVKVLRSKGEIISNFEGKAVKVIGTIQDITSEFILTERLKEREHYLNELNHSLAQKNEELINKNKELESFNFITSHDLQEPLRKIQIFTDRLITENHDNFSGATLNSMARIRDAAHRMQKLIEDFLEFSQTLSPTKGFESVDLNEIVGEAKTELYARLQEKNGIVIYSALPRIKAIRYQMKQLFVNLISNSLKYAQPGERPVIEIHASKHENTLHQPVFKISFHDNGIGFDQKYANKVFDLFQRLHNKNQFSGTGIGLALCKKICDNHNGTITVTSEPMIGSVFTIHLPDIE